MHGGSGVRPSRLTPGPVVSSGPGASLMCRLFDSFSFRRFSILYRLRSVIVSFSSSDSSYASALSLGGIFCSAVALMRS